MSETELLFTILALASVLLVLARKELGFHLLILVIPFSDLLLGARAAETNIRGFNLTTILIYTALLISILSAQKSNRGPALLKGPILALIVVTLASIVWVMLTVPGYPFVHNLARAKRWFDFILMYFIFRNVTTSPEVTRRYIRTLFIGYSIVVLHVTKEFLFTDHARLYGGINQANELGAFLAGYWGLCILMIVERRTKLRLLLGSTIGFMAIVTLVFTLSRGSYVAFLSGLGVMFMCLNRKLLVSLAVITACLFSVVGFDLLPDSAAERIKSAYSMERNGGIELRESAAGRMALNKAAINIIRDHPVAGTGWGCLFIKGRDRLIEAGTDGRHVIHNMYLRIFAALGILGFLPFLLIFWFAFLEGHRLYQRAPPGYFRYFSSVFLSCLAAFFVSNLFGSRMFSGQTAGYFWIMCALVERSIAFISTAERDSSIEEPEMVLSSSISNGVGVS